MEKGLEVYVELVHFLGNVCPRHWEIVLQDVSTQSILAIVNGHVSGRQVGDPLTDHALRIISEEAWKREPYHVNYERRTKDGRRLRSSTWFIRKESVLLGMLCVNVDVQAYESLGRSVLALGRLSPEEIWECPQQAAPVERFHRNVSDMTHAIISDLVSNVSADRLTQEEKIAVVEELDRRGTFLIKGAVSDVAAQLACSEASIYRYLSMVNKRENR